MAKYLEDGIQITARALGAAKYIIMDRFDANSFREQIDALLPKKAEAAAPELAQTTLQT